MAMARGRKRGGYVDLPHAGILATMSTTGMRTVSVMLVPLWTIEYDQIGSRNVNSSACTWLSSISTVLGDSQDILTTPVALCPSVLPCASLIQKVSTSNIIEVVEVRPGI